MYCEKPNQFDVCYVCYRKLSFVPTSFFVHLSQQDICTATTLYIYYCMYYSTPLYSPQWGRRQTFNFFGSIWSLVPAFWN